jgi:hypothetical protein
MLSPEAHRALGRLEHGDRLNVMHTIARELIAAGLARDNFGSLELTEAGRRIGRREYRISDEHHADLFATPAVSHPIDHTADWPPIDRSPNTWWRNPVAAPPLPPEAPPEPETLPPAIGPLAWSRDRARAAAGIANGKTGTWTEPAWVDAFMDAYEG